MLMTRIERAAGLRRAVLCLAWVWVALTHSFAQAQGAHSGAESAQSGASATPQAAEQGAQQPPALSDAQYIIGPGDTIQVFVWRNPELSTTVPVRPDGKISTPLVEDLVAVGRTPAQLARDIEARLAEYIRSPQVSIIVSNAVGSLSQIKVIGQVKSPTSVPYRAGMTVMDVVLAAGGLTDFAAGNRAHLMRKNGKGDATQVKVRLDDLMKKGRIKENIPVQPGDVLIVPQALF
jgi:polysaccharide export outer membrane protein